MTCIAAIVARGKVYIGGDSAFTDGYDLMLRSDEKVFVNGPYVIGICGSPRMGQILRYSFKPPTPSRVSDLRQFMATKFIDAVRQVLTECGFARKEHGEEAGGRFLVGVKGRLFYIDNDYQVGEPRDSFAAIGAGDQIAHGALYAQDITMKPDERVRQALRAAERYNGSVRAPFTVRSL